jgi:hypothetical protein
MYAHGPRLKRREFFGTPFAGVRTQLLGELWQNLSEWLQTANDSELGCILLRFPIRRTLFDVLRLRGDVVARLSYLEYPLVHRE